MRLRLLAPALLVACCPLPAFAHAYAAKIDPALVRSGAPATAFVHARTSNQAAAAARAAGLQVLERYRQVGVVVAAGPAPAVRAAARDRRVSYVEDAGLAISLQLDNAGKATRNTEAQETIRTQDGVPLSGRGVSVAVIDSGIDGTHPFLADGSTSAVVANLKDVCTDFSLGLVPDETTTCWVPVPGNDSDDASAGGHGTHVAGIIAGRPTRVSDPLSGATRTLHGAAPGATVVGLSIGYSLKITGGTGGMNWVLEHHAAPCGKPRASCPPIRVVNNSWGPVGGSAFSPDSVLAKLQRALVSAGVAVVWAAGNDGGDGSGKDPTTKVQSQLTNGPGNDPTPGVLMVAAYDDGGTGSSDAGLAGYSSRGVKGKPATYPDLAAPGSNILSACRPSLSVCAQGGDAWNGPKATDVATFNVLSGTSMATPYVAGAVAELMQLDPSLTPGAIERILESGAHRFGDSYEADPTNRATPTSFDKGHGLLDVLAAADIVQKRAPRPPLALSCGVAWGDPANDANGVEGLANAGASHPGADLRAGRWEWDGTTLAAVFLLEDLSSGGRGAGEDGTYVNWRVKLGSSTNVITIVGGAGANRSFYVFDSDNTTTEQPSLRGEVIDRPGKGADEIRVFLTNADLAGLHGDLPSLAPGLVLTTQSATGGYTVGLPFISADSAAGSCPPVTLG